MKVNKSMILYLGVIAASLTIIGFSLNYFYKQMGGYDELNVITLEPVNRTIVGTSYRGKAQTPVYEELVANCVDQIRNNKLDGVLTIISHKHDTLEANEVNLFVGISLNSAMAEIPYDFEVKELESKDRYAVMLSMHPMVRPSVNKVEKLIIDQAAADSKTLEPMFMELYYMDDSMTVEAWTQ